MPRWLKRDWILVVGGVFFVVMMLGVVRFAGFLEEHHNLATAVATAVIAVFTITLWLTGWFQLRHAREVDRAYLTAGGDIVDGANAGEKVFRLDVENIGRSAAFISCYDVQFATWDQVRNPLPARPVNSSANIHDDRFGPAGSNRSSFKQIPTEVPRPKVADVVYGAVWYTDIWREPRCSRFILRIHSDGHTRTDVGNVDDRYRHWD